MIKTTQMELLSGVHLTAVHTTKFKSCILGVNLRSTLNVETAAENALVPAVLRRGTAAYPTMESISAALDELYGGTLEPVVRRKGETQCVGFVASFLDDAYTPGERRILEPAAALLGEVLLHPATAEGRFNPDYVEGEKANLIDRIRSEVNDKRQYALSRVVREMCAGEPFGVDRLGDEEHAAAITGERLWSRYQDLLHGARIELYYCGSAAPERVKAALLAAFADLPRSVRGGKPVRPSATAAPAQPKLVEEALDVTQGKLTMGFRTGGINVWNEAFPALMVANAIYGGTTTSKLFMNVREKLSLCYYASAQLEKLKGVMLVSSGVEFARVEEAKAEILAQLTAVKRGAFEPWELESARRAVVSALQTNLDAQGRLEDYWLGQAVADLTEGPEALAARVERVTHSEVMAAAGKLELDTIYFLRGKEA